MFEDLTRENVEQYVIRQIGRPAWRDALVKVIERDGERAILKDVRCRNFLCRFTFGRRLIAREFRFYKLLDGVEGVPRAYRMLDKDGVLVEYIDGMPLTQKRLRSGLKVLPEFYDRCMAVIGALHERGIAHLDLRNKKNILFVRGNRPYLVDFASAVHLPGWLPFRRRLIALLGRFDRAGVFKLKRRISPKLLTKEESRFLTRFERTRAVLFPPALLAQWIRRAVRNRRIARRKKLLGPP